MKDRVLIFILLLSLSSWAQERSIRDEYFKEAKQSKQAYTQEWKQNKQDYIAFRRQANMEYLENLKQAWKEYTANKKMPRPKDDAIPPVIYEGEGEKEKEAVEIPVTVLPMDEPQPQPDPIAPIIENTIANDNIEIALYNTRISIRIPKSRHISLSQLDNNAIIDAWQKMSGEDYSNLIYDCIDVRNKYALSDWAYIRFLQLVAEKIYGHASNEAVLLQAFIYGQSGYSMRLAYGHDNRLYMLVESTYTIYDYDYYLINNKKFYPLNCQLNQLYITDTGFKHEKAMSLQITTEQKLHHKSSAERTLTGKSGLSLHCSVNVNTIDFYNNYPTGHIGEDFGTRWATYANVPLEKSIRESLYPQLKKEVAGLSELDAVNLILNWVQTAFVYQLDDKVWGQDRAFFPSETLYYPYCDCEDRSILFSRIIRDVLGLNVVLLYYPGHLATAVQFNTDVKGDYLTVKGKKYIVCDPTYIGAPVGDTMPKMDNQSAKVIVLNR